MSVLPLETGIVYGPVLSRRLGVSLGINLLPTVHKVCSFDCLYCHYGPTTAPTEAPSLREFPSVAEVVSAVQRELLAQRRLDALTFSGNGEPTLHPQFPAIVSRLRELRDELRPEAKLVVFSNSSTVDRPAVRGALAQLDMPILKLDTGDPVTFARLNRPVASIDLETLLDGMAQVAGLIVQSMVVDGKVSTCRGPALEAWIAALARVRPTQAQIYSTDYPTPNADIERVPPYILKRIAAKASERTGVPVEAYWV